MHDCENHEHPLDSDERILPRAEAQAVEISAYFTMINNN
jgi:hypothetical protein